MQNEDYAASVALAESRAKRFNLTQSSIAQALGASQSQVSRVFSGDTSPSSRLATDICNYVSQGARGVSRKSVSDNADLMDALATIWDGSPAHARALATVIRSLGLLGVSSQPNRRKP